MIFQGYTVEATGNPTPLRSLDFCGYDNNRIDIDFPVEYHGTSKADVAAQIVDDFWWNFLE